MRCSTSALPDDDQFDGSVRLKLGTSDAEDEQVPGTPQSRSIGVQEFVAVQAFHSSAHSAPLQGSAVSTTTPLSAFVVELTLLRLTVPPVTMMPSPPVGFGVAPVVFVVVGSV